jgi:hypothetical protein
MVSAWHSNQCDYDASKAVRELSLAQSPVNVALKDTGDWFVSNGYVK